MAEELVFLNPYQMEKTLSGVIPANKVKRPNWFSKSFFGAEFATERETINFDVQFKIRNVMGMFVAPDADTTPIQLPDFGTQELRFSYAKEGLNSPDYAEINVKQLGQSFGQVDPATNEILNVQAKLAFAEERFENLQEKCARDIIFYGGYSAKSEKHPEVRYNFNRVTATTEADVLVGMGGGGLTPAANLTAAAVTAPWDASITLMPVITWTGGGTPKLWNKANIDAGTATPVKDLIKMYETAKYRAGCEACVMDSAAYDWFNYDLENNYSDAASLITAVILRAERDILPRIKDVQGLTFKRSYPMGNGELIDIYIYEGYYNDRVTGVATKYVPSGFVALIPPAENGLKVYGRIMHPKANYAAMPRWLNYWMNPKTGKREWEYHMNFVMGTREINSTVCWKVL